MTRSASDPSRVIVTGGNGYIGRLCVRELVQAGHAVLVVDRAVPPQPLSERATSTVGDIADTRLMTQVMRDHRAQAVIHLAADKSVADSMKEPGPHFRNNVAGSLSLFEAMLEADVRNIVFSSSAAVYGTPDQLPVNENAPLKPENPYGASKAMVEQILHWFHVAHGFNVINLRYFNAAGASSDGSDGENSDRSPNLMPQVLKAMRSEGEELRVYGSDFPTPDGTAIRDYIHVEDLAAAHLDALNVLGATQDELVLNLGTGRGYSVLEVIRAVERASGKTVPFSYAPRRPGDAPAIWADTTRARQLLGWQAKRGLDEIARSAWLWHSRGRG